MRRWAVAVCCLSASACSGVTSSEAGPSLYSRLDAATGVLRKGGQQQGTVFLVSADGLALSGAHLTAGDAELTWDSPDLGTLALERVAADPAHDMALLRLPPRSSPYPFLKLARSLPVPGSRVLGFGHPMMRQRILVQGTWGDGAPSYEYLPDLQCFVEINHIASATLPGMSGGPWVTPSGEVVSVQSGGIVSDGAFMAVCWGARLPDVRRLVEGQESPDTADAGLVVDSLFEKEPKVISSFPKDAAGAVLVRTVRGLVAAGPGLEPGGLIEAADGTSIRHRDDLIRIVRAGRPGATLTQV